MAPTYATRTRRLYKLILRLHRGLPAELRVLGNNYAKQEFKRHKNCTPLEAKTFLTEWTDYAINLSRQMIRPNQETNIKDFGEYIDPKMLEYMSDEQLMQLYELHQAATGQNSQNVVPGDNTKKDNDDSGNK